MENKKDGSFKPCYKWNTFNTMEYIMPDNKGVWVLNLVINGIPSIQIFSLSFW